MKQHISIDQLNELSEKGKDKLRVWLEPKIIESDPLYPNTYKQTGDDWWYGRLLSIGQMIEFLDARTLIYKADVGWCIDLANKPQAVMCDALWEAVKEILDKED